MKRTFLWITSDYQSKFSTLKVKKDRVEDCNLQNMIWFEDHEITEANEFLLELKKYIKYLYCEKYHHSDRVLWMDDEWLKKGNKE